MPVEQPSLLFGVELEQLPQVEESRDCYNCGGLGYIECDMGHEHDCPECEGRGTFDGDGDGGLADEAIAVMRKLGLTTHYEKHCYHCDCGACSPFRSEPLLAAQSDETVGIEWVSRAMRSPNNLLRIIEGHQAVMQRTGWCPDGYESAGNHIHVGIPKELRQQQLATDAFGLIAGLVVAKEWDVLADGGCGTLRGYNYKGQIRENEYNAYRKGYTGSFLCRKTSGATIEYRMWNTPSDPWRIAAHAGLSMAMTLWGLATAEATLDPETLTPARCLEIGTDASLFNIAERYLPINWPHHDEIIELVATSDQ